MKDNIQLSPNLAPSDRVDLSAISYPTFASVKFDGVRTVIMDGIAYSRKFLPLHDVFQKRFQPFLEITKGTPHVLDAECYNPDATFQEITSSLAHEDGCQLWLYVFDYLSKDEWYGEKVTPFVERIRYYNEFLRHNDPGQKYAIPVEQKACLNKEMVQEWLEEVMEAGGEGLMLRDPQQRYKNGRSTAKAKPSAGGGFFKLKPFDTLDAQIIGYELKKRLTEEAKETITDKDAFGRSKRGHRKDDREEVNEIGNLICQVPGRTYTDDRGEEMPFIFKCTWVKGSPIRTDITTENFDKYKGRWVEVEYQEAGMKNLPRLPRAKRYRPDLDN